MRKIRQFIVFCLTIIFILGNLEGLKIQVIYATDGGNEGGSTAAPAIRAFESFPIYEGAPGDKIRISIPIISIDSYIYKPYIYTDVSKDSDYTMESTISLWRDNYVTEPTDINNYEKTYVNFDIKLKDTAKKGEIKIKLKMDFYDSNNIKHQIELITPIIVNVISEKSPEDIVIDHISYKEQLGKEEKTTLDFTITNNGDQSAKKMKVTIEGYEDTGIIPNYPSAIKDIGTMTTFQQEKYSLPVKVSTAATAGTKTLTIKATWVDQEGKDQSLSIPIYITVKLEEEKEVKTDVMITGAQQSPDVPMAESIVTLTYYIENKSEQSIEEVKIMPTNLNATCFSPVKNQAYQYIKKLDAGKKKKITMSFYISKEAKEGLNELELSYTYKDSNGKVGEATVVKLYVINIKNPEKEKEEEKIEEEPVILIRDVSQSPSAPVANGQVTLSYTVENIFKEAIKEIRISPANLSQESFGLMGGEPYVFIDRLEAGEAKEIVMTFSISKEISEGFKEIQLDCNYKTIKGKSYGPISTKVFVLDITNPEKNKEGGTENSKPKIIISDFKTSKKKLKAGGVFTFTFEMLNTHSYATANNIKVTFSSEENIFSQTKGSNSFYVSSMKAGEVLSHDIELKIKADATTKAYPLVIKFEYEYEGIIAESGKEGTVSAEITETINLQVMENSRPVVSNISVGSYEPPVINTPTTLNFEFHNMGKAVLSNVTATVESDSFMTTSNMVFIGNVESGGGDMYEIEVTPTVEGLSNGILVLSFEDSNGDVQKVRTKFEASIQGEYIPDIDMGDMGDMGNMENIEEKKELVSMQLFVGIQCAILVAAIYIGRKITLVIYRKKLQNEEKEEF